MADNNNDEAPIVVTRDGYVLSDPSGIQKVKDRGETHARAIVVEADYEGADEEVVQRLQWLAEELRGNHAQNQDGQHRSH